MTLFSLTVHLTILVPWALGEKMPTGRWRLHNEKDILKLVTVLIANTKGEGKSGDDFWVKAETLLYMALIGYIY